MRSIFVCLLASSIISAGPLYRACADELDGRTLTPVDQLESQIYAGVLDLILGDGGAEGGTGAVTVVSSSERRLVVRIAVTGLNNRDVVVRVVDTAGVPQAGVTTSKTRISGGVMSIEAVLELKPGLDEGFSLISPLLQVLVQRTDGMEVRRQQFALNKNWSVAIAPENLVVPVRAVPIGKALDLLASFRAPTPAAPRPPPRTVRPQIGDDITLDPRRLSLVPRESLTRVTPPVGETIPESRTIRLPPGAVRELSRASPLILANPSVISAIEARPSTSLSTASTTSVSPSVTSRFVMADTTRLSVANSVDYTAVKTESAPLLATLPTEQYRFVDYSRFEFARPAPEEAAAPTSTVPTNMVSNAAPPVFDVVRTEPGISVDLSEVLGMERAIFPDQNPRSGVYYYIPRLYSIAYDREIGGSEGLALRIDYASLADPADTSTAVNVAMTLEAPLDGNSIGVAWQLVQAYAASQPDLPFTELRPLPIASVPAFDFSDSLAGAVDPEQIAVIAFSDFLEGLQVSWRTDPVRAENIRRQLSDVTMGITGRALFPLPSTSGNAVREVPARVTLSDPAIFDAIAFSRTDEVRNVSPLPVRLKYLHALVLAADGGPRIYSWSLGDTTIPAKSRVALDLTDFPADMDAVADRIWVDYRLDPDCGDCVRDVVEELLRGGVWPDTAAITVAPLPSLFQGDVAEIVMHVRSRFLKPTDRSVAEAPAIYLRAGETPPRIEPLFMGEQIDPDTGVPWSLFEYRLSVTRENGEQTEGTNWIAANALRVTPGSFQLNQSLGIVAEPPSE